jgi:hypothetical protein
VIAPGRFREEGGFAPEVGVSTPAGALRGKAEPHPSTPPADAALPHHGGREHREKEGREPCGGRSARECAASRADRCVGKPANVPLEDRRKEEHPGSSEEQDQHHRHHNGHPSFEIRGTTCRKRKCDRAGGYSVRRSSGRRSVRQRETSLSVRTWRIAQTLPASWSRTMEEGNRWSGRRAPRLASRSNPKSHSGHRRVPPGPALCPSSACRWWQRGVHWRPP